MTSKTIHPPPMRTLGAGWLALTAIHIAFCGNVGTVSNFEGVSRPLVMHNYLDLLWIIKGAIVLPE